MAKLTDGSPTYLRELSDEEKEKLRKEILLEKERMKKIIKDIENGR